MAEETLRRGERGFSAERGERDSSRKTFFYTARKQRVLQRERGCICCRKKKAWETGRRAQKAGGACASGRGRETFPSQRDKTG